MKTKILWTVLFYLFIVSLGIMGGIYHERNRILRMCLEKHHEVYYNKSILRCQVIDIDKILTKNYWEH